MDNILRLENLHKLSSSQKHCAFTDLINNPFSKDMTSFLCCYREASDHVSLDGVIRIHAVDSKMEVISDTTLSIADTDLRDPKFMFDGAQLVVTAYAKTKHKDSAGLNVRMVSYCSCNGVDWVGPTVFSKSNYWIWRSTWHKDTAYGFGYKRADEQINLYHGHPAKEMKIMWNEVLSLAKHQSGYPNESHILFDDADNATAIVRRDADTYSAKLGVAVPPYSEWTWKDLEIYIGGPVLAPLTSSYFLVAGRDWDEKNDDKLTTKLWLLDKTAPCLTELLTLPSAGDTSYPGLSIIKDTIYLSYYSSHEQGQTCVYFAKISGVNALLDVIKQA